METARAAFHDHPAFNSEEELQMKHVDKASLFGAWRRRSSELLICGILISSSSQGWYFLGGGDVARYLALGTGVVLLLLASFARSPFPGPRLLLMAGSAASVGVVGIVHAVALKQDVFDGASPLIHFIAFVHLLVGLSLGDSWRPAATRGSDRFVLVGLLLSMVSMAGTFVHGVNFGQGEGGRLFGAGEFSPISVAYYHGVIFVCAASVALASGSKMVRLASAIAALLAAAVSIATGSRGGFLWMTVVLVWAFWAIGVRGKRIVLSLTGIGGAVLVVVGSVLAGSSPFREAVLPRAEVWGQRMQSLYESFVYGEIDQSSEDRIALMGRYVSEPSIAFPFGEFGYAGYPHNQFVEWYARFGVIGVVASALSLVLLFRVLKFKRLLGRSRDREILVVSACFLFAYFQSMTSLSLEMNRSLWLGFGFSIGIGHRLLRRNRSSRESRG